MLEHGRKLTFVPHPQNMEADGGTEPHVGSYASAVRPYRT